VKPLTHAIRFWEIRRILYNSWLAFLTFAAWGPEILAEKNQNWLEVTIVIGSFAFAANALYCTAYIAEGLLNLAPTKTIHSHGRTIVFLCGMTIATALALWILLGRGMA